MSEVTLIGEKLAKEGLEFAFGGCLSRCQSCEIKNSCCGLEKNKWYKVTSVRENSHECDVHNGSVKVVVVEDIPIHTSLKARGLIEGAIATLESKNCKSIDCKHYLLCNPPGVEPGGRYHVESVGKKIQCPKGLDIKEVELL